MCHQVQRSRLGAEDCRRRDRRQHSRQPGTSGQSPELLADPELLAADDFDQPRRANSLVSPDPAPDLPAPGTSGLPGPSGPRMPTHFRRANSLVKPDPPRNLRRPELPPSPELPALPARSHLGRGPCTLSSPRLYILYPVRISRVSDVGLPSARNWA